MLRPREAEAMLEATDYAVVIADLRLLTGLHGVEGLESIQRSRRLRPRARVVTLTGNGTPEFEARRRGADAFPHKPLPLVHLEAVVESLFPAVS